MEFVAHVSTELSTVHSVQVSIGATPKNDVARFDAQCVISNTNLCEVGDVTKASAKDIDFTLTIASSMTSGTIRVATEAFSTPDHTDATTTPYPLKVTNAPKPKPKPTRSSGASSGSSGSSSSNASNASGASGASNTSSGSSLPVGGTSPVGGGRMPGDSTVLPSIAPQQTQAPVTAPVQNTGNSQRMRGTAAADDALTFDKLASTQAAWLAALLVAFSLLLTQIRLGRTVVRAPRPKGAHRRPRRSGGAH